MLSGTQLAGEAERIMADRDYTPFPIAVDGVQTSGLRFNSRLVVPDTTAMFLVVHHGHLVAIESHDGRRGPTCPRYGPRRRRRHSSAMINAEAMRND